MCGALMYRIRYFLSEIEQQIRKEKLSDYTGVHINLYSSVCLLSNNHKIKNKNILLIPVQLVAYASNHIRNYGRTNANAAITAQIYK